MFLFYLILIFIFVQLILFNPQQSCKSHQQITHYRMDNQFINAPLLVSNKQIYIDPKQQLIRGLQLKNAKLKTQLIKIQRAIEDRLDDDRVEEQPRKRQSIFQNEESVQVLTKQLANTYKRIKMYEYEINKLEDHSKNVTVSQKTSQTDVIIKQKKHLVDKLKAQIVKQQKLIQENMKKLGNNNQRDEMEQYVKQLTEQAKFYKQKIKGYEQIAAMKQTNMKKQYENIKKLERDILEGGGAVGQLDEIKQRAIRGNGASKVQNNEKSKQEAVNNSEEEIEQKTRERFDALLGQVNLLEKLKLDHEKQLIQAEEEKQETIKRNLIERNKLLQCENEIQNLEKQIVAMKNRIVPSNMKPLKPIRSMSSHQSEHQAEKIIVSRSSIKMPKGKGLSHLIKFDQAGVPSDKGQRFTDRLMLGKSNLHTKVTGLKVYLDKITNAITGIQCTYNGHKKGTQHVSKDKEANEKQYIIQEYNCKQQCYFLTVGGTLTEDNKIQSLVLNTSDGFQQKFGVAKCKRTFSFDIGPNQFPVCIFGTILILKQPGKKQTSLIEHLGFQINNDKGGGSIILNEFNE